MVVKLMGVRRGPLDFSLSLSPRISISPHLPRHGPSGSDLPARPPSPNHAFSFFCVSAYFRAGREEEEYSEL